MNTNEMWRQADKSFIHPSDMHDKHIINALRKGAHALFQFKDIGSLASLRGESISANIDKWTKRQWNNILVANPTLIKLFDEAVRRGLIAPAGDEPRNPGAISPLAEAFSGGHPVARCHSCNSPFIKVFTHPFNPVKGISCTACSAYLLSKDSIADWNSLYLLKNAAKVQK